jgi:hypothetical protein
MPVLGEIDIRDYHSLPSSASLSRAVSDSHGLQYPLSVSSAESTAVTAAMVDSPVIERGRERDGVTTVTSVFETLTMSSEGEGDGYGDDDLSPLNTVAGSSSSSSRVRKHLQFSDN